MAKIKFSEVVADARGHIGGTVFSRNASGAYIREKVSPVNPQTPRQLQVRARLSAISKEWGQLQFGRRQAWTVFAKNHPVINVFGNQVVLSGIAMFQRINGILLNIAEPILVQPPANLDVPDLLLDSVIFDANVNQIHLAFSGPVLGPFERVYAFSTDEHPVGVAFVKNRFKFLGSSLDTALTPVILDLPSTRAILVLDRTYTVKAAVVNSKTGAVGVFQQLTAQSVEL